MRERMVRQMLAFVALVLAAGVTGGPLSAAGSETFEPGTGKYVLVLKEPPSEKLDPVTGKKKSTEPDVVKHGGKLLHKKELVRIVKLPRGAAKQLRKEENVAYVQRVWVGESREEWEIDEEETSLSAEPDLESLADLTWTTGQYAYDGSGNIKQIGSDTYRYDTAGRLIQAVVKGTTESYGYDAFGNLISRTTGSVTVATPASATNNRLTSESYDAAGNATTRGGTPAYTFDSVSMMDTHTKSGTTHRMIYGPDDERIGVVQEGTQGRWKVRGFDGKVLREYRSDDNGSEFPWVWMKDYVYAEGKVIGTERMEVFGGKRHFHTDHLGTVRMITDQQKCRVSVHEYFPFGIEKTDATQEFNNTYDPTNPGGAAGDFAADAMKYTGHERDFRGWLNVDNDDYLDYMHARYYDPNSARFLSVDPGHNWKKAMVAPQAWNRYAYARNNPMRMVDPDGRDDTDFRILTARVNVIYSNADGKINSRGETLRQVTEQGITHSRAFFSEAGIKLQVSRFEGTINTQALGNINGPVNTGGGQVELSSFIKSSGGALTVLVSGDLAGVTGKTVGVGGPTMIGNVSNNRTFNDEIAHALGNVTAVNVPLVSNTLADVRLDIQEYSVDKGWGLGRWFRETFRENLDKLQK